MNRSIRLDSLGTLSDNRLIRQLESLRGKERNVLTGILRHLIEMEKRRLYLPRGYSSLFEFCTQHLKYSRSAAGRRIASARALARFPALEKYLLNGEINLYSLSLASGIMTKNNIRQVISGIRNRSSREVETLVSGFRPGKVLRDRVRPVCVMVPDNTGIGAGPTPGAGSNGSVGTASKATTSDNPGNDGTASRTHGSSPTPGAGSGRQLVFSSSRPEDKNLEHVRISRKFRLEFAVEPEFMKKIDRLKTLLSSRFPEGIGFEDMFSLLMDEYIDRHSPEGRTARRLKRQGEKMRKEARQKEDGRSEKYRKKPKRTQGNGSGEYTDRFGKGTATNSSRKIPRKLRDEIFIRDGERCTFRGTDGKRCNSKWNLQIDHIIPIARGGDSSPGNLRLLCGKHNRLEAERLLGRLHQDRFKKRE
jgi:hypothetical protein